MKIFEENNNKDCMRTIEVIEMEYHNYKYERRRKHHGLVAHIIDK